MVFKVVWYVNASEDISHAEGQYFQHIWAEPGVPAKWSLGEYKGSLENCMSSRSRFTPHHCGDILSDPVPSKGKHSETPLCSVVTCILLSLFSCRTEKKTQLDYFIQCRESQGATASSQRLGQKSSPFQPQNTALLSTGVNHVAKGFPFHLKKARLKIHRAAHIIRKFWQCLHYFRKTE